MNEIQYLAEEINNCRKCSLGFERTNSVPGEGPYSASIVFIGEAPGHNEDLQGKPFVGAAGRLLDDLLLEVGFKFWIAWKYSLLITVPSVMNC